MGAKPTLPEAGDVGPPEAPSRGVIPLPPGTIQDEQTISIPKPEGGFQRFAKSGLSKGLLNRLVFVGGQAPGQAEATLVSPITGQPLDEATQKEHHTRLKAEDFDAQLANLIEASTAPEWPGKTQVIEEIKQRIAHAARASVEEEAPEPKAPKPTEPTTQADEAPEPVASNERVLTIPEQALLDVGVAPAPRAIVPMEAEMRPPIQEIPGSAPNVQYRRLGFPGESNEVMSRPALEHGVKTGRIGLEEIPEEPPVRTLPTQPVQPAMPDPDFKVLEEQPDHFRVQKGDGPAFKVAKAGLGNKLVQRIQAFAKGGEVEPATDENAEAPDAFMDSLVKGWEASSASRSTSASGPMGMLNQMILSRNMDVPGSPNEMAGAAEAAGLTPQQVSPGINEQDRATLGRVLPRLLNPVGVAQEMERQPDPTPPPNLGAKVEGLNMVEQLPPAPEPTMSGPVPPPVEQQGGSMSASVSGPVVMNANTGTVGRVEQGLKEQEAGIKAQTDAEVARAKAMEQVHAEQVLKAQAMEQEATKQLAEHQMLADRAAQDVLNAKVDPNRYWKGQGTAQAATSIIGLILGAVGAANTGQNSVVPLIDKAIERDIDAQKTELGKKENFLSYMLQRGHDLQSSIQFRKAFMMDVFAAQLQNEAAKTESPIIRAKGMEAAAQWKIQGAQIRQQAVLNDVQIANARAAMRLAGVQQQQALEALAVPLPDGRVVYARNKEFQKDVAEAATAYEQAQSSLQKLKAFRKQYGAEKMPGTELAAAKVIASSLQSDVRVLKRMGTHDKGAQEILDDIVSRDPGQIGFEMGRLEALEGILGDVLRSALRPRILPMQATQPAVPGLRKVQ